MRKILKLPMVIRKQKKYYEVKHAPQIRNIPVYCNSWAGDDEKSIAN
jgi:hypothetical protein